jgi:hypothetical protein
MAEYYKYADRSADDYINWGQVGKNMSDMLTKTYELREERKATLDKDTNDALEYAANSPLGEHKGANDAVLDLGHNAAQFLLMQTKLFKSGKLSEQDYVRSRQKIMDGVKAGYGAIQNYQKVFSDKMERYNTLKSSAYEVDSMGDVEGFGDFTKSGFFINPTTGEVNIAQKEESNVNGQKVYTMSSHPSKSTTVAALNGLILGKWDRYNLDANTVPFVNNIGDKLTAIRQIGSQTKAGSISELLDPTKDIYMDDASKQIIASFTKAESNAIDAMLANDFNRASLITDYMKFKGDKQYHFTKDEKEAANDPTAILKIGDSNTGQYKLQFSKQQIEDSNQWMRERLRSMYDKKETMKTYEEPKRERPQAFEVENARKDAGEQRIGKNLGMIAYGNAKQVESARSYLESINPGTTIERSGTGLVMTDSEGRSKQISFIKDGKPLSAYEIGNAGASFFGGEKVNPDLVAKGAASFAGKNSFNNTTVTKSAAPKSTKNPAFEADVTQNVDIVSGDAEKTIAKLAPYAKYGIVVKKDPKESDKIIITLPNKTEVPISLDFSTDAERSAVAKQIQGLIINNAYQKNRDNDFPMTSDGGFWATKNKGG